MDKVIIIVPCYNEENAVDRFFAEVQKHTRTIPDCVIQYLFINDGSRDGTLDKLRELAKKHTNVKYVSLSRNFGKEAAMMAGLDYAEGDAVIIMDADLQHPPCKIPEMIKYWRQGYDDVCGKRIDRAGESLFKRTCANIFYAVSIPAFFLKVNIFLGNAIT